MLAHLKILGAKSYDTSTYAFKVNADVAEKVNKIPGLNFVHKNYDIYK